MSRNDSESKSGKNSNKGSKSAGSTARNEKSGKTSMKSASNTQKKKSSAGKNGSKARPESTAMHWRREICGFIFLLLMILSIAGLFDSNALFVRWFSLLCRGLVGYGYYILPLMLLISAVILIAHHSRPVMARVICALLVPVTAGAMIHLLICSISFSAGLSAIAELYQYGVAMKAGGVLAGGLALLLQFTTGRIPGIIITLVATFLLFVYPLNMTLFTIIRAIRERPRPESETGHAKSVSDEPVDTAKLIVDHVARKQIDRVQRKAEQKAERRSASDFDIPVDDPLPVSQGTNSALVPDMYNCDYSGNYDNPDSLTAVIRPAEDENLLEDIPQASHVSHRKRADVSSRNVVQFPVQQKSADQNYVRTEQLPVVQLPVTNFTLEDSKDFLPENMEPVCESADSQSAEPPAVSEQLTEAAAVLAADNKKVHPDEARQAAVEVAFEISSAASEQQTVYSPPPLELLSDAGREAKLDNTEEILANSERLRDTLDSFNIDATLKNVICGPSVTRYELELDRGVKLSKLTNLADDIALALGASGVRIAAIPDRVSIVGIEVPNRSVRTVPLREVIDSAAFRQHQSDICFAVGLDISSNCIVSDIARLPHLLIAGTTGSGKSVCTNSLIISLLYKSSPEDVRLIMVDPKMVELGIYNGIPHLLIPVVTDPKKAAGALQWAVTEMMRRYRLMSEAGVRDLESYNRLAAADPNLQKMPKIVVVIDELADLMLVAAKEVEESICRVAQMGRASGMHLIIATQRPSADVITGLMKANIPSRIAFAVASQLESRIILDASGAEKLVGKGDMLYAPLGGGKPRRVQGCFITDREVQAVVDYIKGRSAENYSADVIEQIENHTIETENKGGNTAASSESIQNGDELFPAAVDVILETGQASVSMLQRRLKLGYARAARIVDEMEDRGIVGPFEGSKPRQLLITREQWEAMQNGGNSSTDSSLPEDERSPLQMDQLQEEDS